MKKLMTFFSLFGSMTTLLCCALPVALVSIGMGATFASLTASFPEIIWLTEKKDYLFVFTGIMLIISYFMLKKSDKLPCPIDEKQKEVCQSSKSLSQIIFWISVIIFLIGLSFSYIFPLFI